MGDSAKMFDIAKVFFFIKNKDILILIKVLEKDGMSLLQNTKPDQSDTRLLNYTRRTVHIGINKICQKTRANSSEC